MMKKHILNTAAALVAASSLLLLASCSDDEALSYPSAVDTKVMPLGQWVDDSHRPGDDYFMYRNGRYWAGHAINSYFYEGFLYTELPQYVNDVFRPQMAYDLMADWEKVVMHHYQTDEAAVAETKQNVAEYLALLDAATDLETLARAEAEVMRRGGSGLFDPYAYSFVDEDGITKPKQFLSPSEFAVTCAEHPELPRLLVKAGYTAEESEAMTRLIQSEQDLQSERLSSTSKRTQKLLDLLDPADLEANRLAVRSTRSTSAPRFDELVASALGWDEHYLHTATDGNSASVVEELESISLIGFDILKAYCIVAAATDLVRGSNTELYATFDDYFSLYFILFEEYDEDGPLGTLRKYTDTYYAFDLVEQSAERARVIDMIEECRSVLSRRIERNDWMSSTTKAAAQEKLAAMKFFVGGVDEWPEFESRPLGDNYCENLRQLRTMNLELIEQMPAVDRLSASMLCLLTSPFLKRSVFEVNASTIYRNNSVFINSTNLIPALTDPSYSDAFLYGTLGGVITHEMLHGFDSAGSNYDKDGRYSNWWTESDRAEFDRRSQLLVETYSELLVYPEVDPELHVDGEKSLNENIAEVGGFALAYEAYMEKLGRDGFYDPNELTRQSRRFFESFAEFWRARYTYKDAVYYTENDPHLLEHNCVNGLVRNLDAWYETYDVQASDSLYLAPERRYNLY